MGILEGDLPAPPMERGCARGGERESVDVGILLGAGVMVVLD